MIYKAWQTRTNVLAQLIEDNCRHQVHSCHNCHSIARALRMIAAGKVVDTAERVYSELCKDILAEGRPWHGTVA